MKVMSLIISGTVVLMISACGSALKSQYVSPKVNYPPKWQTAFAEKGVNTPFSWQDFNDPKLNNWLKRVSENNSNLAIAALRLNKAKLVVQALDVEQSPSFKAGLAATVNHSLLSSQTVSQATSFGLTTGYELDLWGKLARQRDAADWETQATEQDVTAAGLSLLATASQNYWQLAFINRRLELAQENIDDAHRILTLVNVRHAAGKVSGLEPVTAESNVLEQENAYFVLQHAREILLNAQATLLGAPPGTKIDAPTPLAKITLPAINPGIPAAVLQNRPDVKAGEMRLRKALNQTDIKRLQYYPSFSLTAELGTHSAALVNFMSHPLLSVGSAISLPFVEWRKMNLDVQLSENDYQQQKIAFTQTLYHAMGEIDNALSLRAELQSEQIKVQQALLLATQSARLNAVRYRQGRSTLDVLLDAQQSRRRAELAVDENRLRQYQNLAQIYLALGGES
ncbi:RND transporter [Serratia sp. Leaf50]|nr:RND transporter [Serratia sp. Leaf50]